VISIRSRKIFYTKVIDAETKFCWTSVVFPKTSRVPARMVSVWSKLVHEVFVCKECSLFEFVHAFFDSDVDITSVGDKSVQIVMFANSVGEILVPDAHKFRILPGRSKKMILEIGTEKTSTFVCIKDGTVENEFGLQERGCRRSSIIVVRKFITTNSETYSIRLGFEGAIIADKIAIGDLFILWHFMLLNEIDSISAEDSISSEPLGQLSVFVT
jgi:hypothetical protein